MQFEVSGGTDTGSLFHEEFQMSHLALIQKKASQQKKREAFKLALLRKQCQSSEAIG